MNDITYRASIEHGNDLRRAAAERRLVDDGRGTGEHRQPCRRRLGSTKLGSTKPRPTRRDAGITWRCRLRIGRC